LQLLQYARGEKLYQHDLNIKAVVDNRLSIDAILSGKERIPPQGAGFDVAVEGRSTGQLSGRIRGVDYIWARADWRIELDIRATLETDDGNRIALSETGVGRRC